jgi:prepilin-type N-terminal cleavage/methylation domain-containing protein
MNSKNLRRKSVLTEKKQGFTIIEVVIVLVIGAIIMLMVFLIVPYLQRTQRDARRQQAARSYITAAEQWATNHQGNYPANAAEGQAVVDDYIDGNEIDEPTTNNPMVIAFNVGQPAQGTLNYRTNAQCGAGANANRSVAGGGNGRIAVTVFQENGVSFCVAN